MAKAETPGSDRTELKKLLKTAAGKPVSMAFAMAKDGTAIIKLDKMKPPRTLEKMLKESEGSKNHRFGTVVIDPDEPKIAMFVINKEVGGFARKLVVALKGTGFSKVKLVTEDGPVARGRGRRGGGRRGRERRWHSEGCRPGGCASCHPGAVSSRA